MTTNDRTIVFADAAYVWSILASRNGVMLNQLHGDFRGVATMIAEHVATQIGLPVWMSRWYDADYETNQRYRQPNPRAAEVGRIPGVRLCMGRTVDVPGETNRQVQKGVDTSLVVDMTLAAVKGTATHLVLLSGDDDMEPGVVAAQDMGVTVTLLRVVDENSIPMGVSRFLQAVVNQVIDLPVTALIEAFGVRTVVPIPGEYQSPVPRPMPRATIPVDCLSFVSMEGFLHAVEDAKGKDAEAVAVVYAEALVESGTRAQNQCLFRWHEAEGSNVPFRVDKDLLDFAGRAGLDAVSQDVRKVLRNSFTKAVGLGLPVKLDMTDVVPCDVENIGVAAQVEVCDLEAEEVA